MQILQIRTAVKALRQLGFTQVAFNALYRFGLVSGHYRRLTPSPQNFGKLELIPIMPMPTPEALRLCLGKAGLDALLLEADEIANGKFRQFGAEPVELQLGPQGPLSHWTDYETGKINLRTFANDIKLIWEPARFGWAFVLGRAFHASQDEGYARAFWQRFESFNLANPAYLGPNWVSAQEVGLRLLAWIWCAQVFAGSEHSSPERLASLVDSIAMHAVRIPITLPYARSQNNNHLLMEALALVAAGLSLPAHLQAAGWLKTGQGWLSWCFVEQIDSNGEYVQHSTNYQRLMLQAALWVNALANGEHAQGFTFPGGTPARGKLSLASLWLASQLDPQSGQVPNLGANDGALIFPLASSDFSDYRPVVQAALRAFVPAGTRLPAGAWDEMSLWFGLPQTGQNIFLRPPLDGQIQSSHGWGSLRAVEYKSRPSHVDQLHCELWWRGLNIACDAGTYRYNDAPPWDNQLTSTLVHNTVSLNGAEQMTRAGRFLYLDWAGAFFNKTSINPSFTSVSAWTDAYARYGVRHTRSLTVFNDEHWLVQDEMTNTGRQNSAQPANVYRLHWLLPDWEWKLEAFERNALLSINSPHGWVSLTVSTSIPFGRVALLRAGELLQGDGLVSPVLGWYSPTYNVKKPALSLAVEVQSVENLILKSEFVFPAIE